MMRFDHRRFSKPRFDHIRINSALYKKIHRTDFLCLFFKHPDKLFSNHLSLLLRLGNACKFFVKTLLRVHTDKVQVIRSFRPKNRLYLIALIFAQKTVINKHTCQLPAHRFGQENRRHRRIHTAGQRTQHLTLAHFIAHCRNGRLHKGIHLPVAAAAAYIYHKVSQHRHAFYRMHDLRVKLYRIQSPFRAFHCRNRTNRRVRRHPEIHRRFFNIIGMAHPADRLCRYPLEQSGALHNFHLGLTVFTDRRGGHFSAQKMCHKLRTVADPQNRNAQLEKLSVTENGSFAVYTVWSPR